MSNEQSKEWTLKELAKETGVRERTIRFYISRGLVDPPLRAGKGAAYSEKHRDRLLDIRARQAKGETLAKIANSLASGTPEWQAYEKSPRLFRYLSRRADWLSLDRIENLSACRLADESFVTADKPVSASPIPQPELWAVVQAGAGRRRDAPLILTKSKRPQERRCCKLSVQSE